MDLLEDELGSLMNRITWSDDEKELKRLNKRYSVLYNKFDVLGEQWQQEYNRMIDEGLEIPF